MKRLITAQDVEKTFVSNDSIIIDNNTIITPQAMDIIHEKKICLIKENENVNPNHSDENNNDLFNKNYSEVISCDDIYRLLKCGIEKNLFSENDLINMIRG